MKKVLYVILFLISCCSGLLAQGAPDHPITLQEALKLLQQNSPILAAGRLNAQSIQANEITAYLRPNPVFSSANEDFNIFNPSKFDIANTQEFTQNVSELWERGGKRRKRLQSAQWATAITKDLFADGQRAAELQVKLGFVSMLLAKADLALAHDNLADYRRNIEANRLRLQAGDISQTDFDRIVVQESQFQTDLLNAQLAVNQARVQLEQVIGLDDNPKFDIAGDLAQPSVVIDLDTLKQDALAHRPDYIAARDTISKAQADVSLAYANGATDFNIGGEYKRNGPDNTVGFTLQFPLRFFDKNQGEKLRTQRVLEASRFGEVAARLQVTSDVKQAYDAYQTALTRSQLYTNDYLKRARSVRDNMEFSYRNGGANLLDYLDAVRSYRDVEVAARAAQAQLLSALHTLSFVTATELLP
jgi:cobalt-zinc-cadmium efflux system outer membrane protein